MLGFKPTRKLFILLWDLRYPWVQVGKGRQKNSDWSMLSIKVTLDIKGPEVQKTSSYLKLSTVFVDSSWKGKMWCVSSVKVMFKIRGEDPRAGLWAHGRVLCPVFKPLVMFWILVRNAKQAKNQMEHVLKVLRWHTRWGGGLVASAAVHCQIAPSLWGGQKKKLRETILRRFFSSGGPPCLHASFRFHVWFLHVSFKNVIFLYDICQENNSCKMLAALHQRKNFICSIRNEWTQADKKKLSAYWPSWSRVQRVSPSMPYAIWRWGWQYRCFKIIASEKLESSLELLPHCKRGIWFVPQPPFSWGPTI